MAAKCGMWSPGLLAMMAACAQPQCDIDLGAFNFPPFGTSCPSGSNVAPPPGGLAFELTPPYFASFGAGPGELDLFSPSSELDVALGGSAALTVLADDGSPFAQPFEARSESAGTVAITSQTGTTAMLEGSGVGNACIDITEPQTDELFGGLETGTAPMLSAAVVPAAPRELIDNDFSGYAFAAGDLEIGVMYFGDYAISGPRLIDLGATLQLDRATQTDWQTLSFQDATVGSYSIEATAGSAVASASLEVVDPSNSARSLVRFDEALHDRVCFAALTQTGWFITGLQWGFSIDGRIAGATADASNCVAVPSDGATHTISVLAGGQSTAITVVGA
jgi:hypothetical protein